MAEIKSMIQLQQIFASLLISAYSSNFTKSELSLYQVLAQYWYSKHHKECKKWDTYSIVSDYGTNTIAPNRHTSSTVLGPDNSAINN